MKTEDLKLREINLFLELSETNSVRELARRHNMQPGQVSKLVRGLEHKIGFPLLERSNTGVRLTAKAAEIIPLLREFQNLQQKLSGVVQAPANDQVLSFASASFFSTHFVPNVISKISKEQTGVRLRMMDLAPSQFIPVALRGAFQFCIHMQDLDWPRTWTSVPIGHIRWLLCCRKGHPLTKKPNLKEALKYPFVYPIYWTSNGIRYGQDNCPLPIDKRILGHETTTALSARELVRSTDHIGFLPEIVLRQSMSRDELDVVEIPSWKPVKEMVYLSVKNDVVKQKTFEEIRKICEAEIAAEA